MKLGLGLSLDKGMVIGSTPDPYGEERVLNGGFDSGASWDVATASWSISDGLLTNDGTGQWSTAYQYNRLTIGVTYRVEFTITGYVSGTVRARCGDGGAGTNRSANGTYIQEITCASNGHISIQCQNFFNGSIDNVSVKEVL